MVHVAKSTYAYPNNSKDNLWKMYRRAIICDGVYTPYYKSDVAHVLLKWCYANKDNINDYRISDPIRIVDELKDMQRRFKLYYNEDCSDIDMLTIELCHSIIQGTSTKMYTKLILPSKEVLPLASNAKDFNNEWRKNIFKKYAGLTDADISEYKREYASTLFDDIIGGELPYSHETQEKHGVRLDNEKKIVTVDGKTIAKISDDGTINCPEYICMSEYSKKKQEALTEIILNVKIEQEKNNV